MKVPGPVRFAMRDHVLQNATGDGACFPFSHGGNRQVFEALQGVVPAPRHWLEHSLVMQATNTVEPTAPPQKPGLDAVFRGGATQQSPVRPVPGSTVRTLRGHKNEALTLLAAANTTKLLKYLP
jgi:hypothetical protein